MPDIASFFKTLSKVPWPRLGSMSATVLLLTRFESAGTWGAFVRLLVAMMMLVLLPFVAELLHRRYLARCA